MIVDAAAIARDPRLPRWLRERKPVRTTRLATRDELACSAFLHTTPRAECEDDLDAFVRLWLHDQRIAEEVASIDAQFFMSSLPPSRCVTLSQTEWDEETALHVRVVRDAIVQRKLAPHELASWGIFVDGVRVDETSFRFELPGRFEAAVAARKKWNDVALVARTTDVYALFTWATGA